MLDSLLGNRGWRRYCSAMRLLPFSFALVFTASLFSEQPARPVAKVLQPYVDNHELAGAVTMVASGTVSRS